MATDEYRVPKLTEKLVQGYAGGYMLIQGATGRYRWLILTKMWLQSNTS